MLLFYRNRGDNVTVDREWGNIKQEVTGELR